MLRHSNYSGTQARLGIERSPANVGSRMVCSIMLYRNMQSLCHLLLRRICSV